MLKYEGVLRFFWRARVFLKKFSLRTNSSGWYFGWLFQAYHFYFYWVIFLKIA